MSWRSDMLSTWCRYTASMALKMFPRVEFQVRKTILHAILRQLNDVLAATPLQGHYWLEGGLLLGWARSGEVLPNDSQDADFFFLADDYPRFAAAVPSLESAGFTLRELLRDNDGEVIAAHFGKRGCTIDFLKVAPEDGRLVVKALYPQPVQFVLSRPDSPRVWFDLFGRRWQKPEDHEATLAAQYGDWRSRAVVGPAGLPAWSGPWCQERDNPGILTREAWKWTCPLGYFDGNLAEHVARDETLPADEGT